MEGRAVYVRGIPPEWSRADVEEFFGRWWTFQLQDSHLLPPRKGQRSCVAFVNFTSPEDAAAAIKACDGYVINDSEGQPFWLGCSLKTGLRERAEVPRTDFSVPSEILDGFLFLGNQENARNETMLESLGITHILCVAPEDGATSFAGRRELQRLVLAVDDTEDAEVSAVFGAACVFIEQARHSMGRVLVHCVAGKSRSVAVVLAYMLRHGGLTLREAFEHVKQRRPVAGPNPGFWAQLEAEELQVLGENSPTPFQYRKSPRQEAAAPGGDDSQAAWQGRQVVVLQLAAGSLSGMAPTAMANFHVDMSEFSRVHGVWAWAEAERECVLVDPCGSGSLPEASLLELEQVLVHYRIAVGARWLGGAASGQHAPGGKPVLEASPEGRPKTHAGHRAVGQRKPNVDHASPPGAGRIRRW